MAAGRIRLNLNGKPGEPLKLSDDLCTITGSPDQYDKFLLDFRHQNGRDATFEDLRTVLIQLIGH